MADEELKLKARELWIKGVSKYEIAKAVGRRRTTVENWAKEGDWRDVQIKTSEQVMITQEIDLIKEKERSLKLIKATESLYAKELQTATGMPKSVPAFAQLQKVKWEILMPKTISQYNFMKQENTTNVLNQKEVTRLLEVLDGNTQAKDL